MAFLYRTSNYVTVCRLFVYVCINVPYCIMYQAFGADGIRSVKCLGLFVRAFSAGGV